MSEFQRPQFGIGQTPRFVMLMVAAVAAIGVAYAGVCFVQLNGVRERLSQAEELSRLTSTAISSVVRATRNGQLTADDTPSTGAASFDGSIAFHDWSASHAELSAAVTSTEASASDDDLGYVMSKLEGLHEAITASDSGEVGGAGPDSHSVVLDGLVRYQEGTVAVLENTTAAYRTLASRCIQILAVVFALWAASSTWALSHLLHRMGAAASVDRAISVMCDVVRDEVGRGQSKLTMLAQEVFAQRRADQEIRIELAELQSTRRA